MTVRLTLDDLQSRVGRSAARLVIFQELKAPKIFINRERSMYDQFLAALVKRTRKQIKRDLRGI